MFLTYEEIVDLTHKQKWRAQSRALKMMGIDHKVRPDGTLAVLKSHVEQELGAVLSSSKSKAPEPNWAALG